MTIWVNMCYNINMNIDKTETFVLKKKRGFFDMNFKERCIFLTQVIGVFLVVFMILAFFGFLPKQWSLIENNVVILPNDTTQQNLENYEIDDKILGGDDSPSVYTRPNRVYIPSVDIDTVVTQPENSNVSVLDQFLQKGAVHYPGSGTVESGNMFIFGHSTNWAVVRNQAYKTFNGLENLQKGDEIFVESGGETYAYEVEYVELVDENEALIDLSGNSKRLTISTCNSFGEKQERWVAHANFKQIM